MTPVDRLKLKRGSTPSNAVAIRVFMGLLLAASLTLVWWQTRRLLPLQQEARSVNANLARLNLEIQQMESRWNPGEVERLLARFNELPDQLFQGRDSLAAWLEELQKSLVPLALDARADLSRFPVQTNLADKVTTIPATLSFEVKPAQGIESYKSPYQRVLRLTQYLSTQQKRADLVELQVVGQSNSVNRAVAILDLWAGDPTL